LVEPLLAAGALDDRHGSTPRKQFVRLPQPGGWDRARSQFAPQPVAQFHPQSIGLGEVARSNGVPDAVFQRFFPIVHFSSIIR
jgi:hypothetical protein